MPTADQILVWVIVGLLGGASVAALITRERRGFGLLGNLALGLAGALVGGFLFWAFALFPGLEKISMRDVVAAVLGSLIVVMGRWLYRTWREPTAP